MIAQFLECRTQYLSVLSEPWTQFSLPRLALSAPTNVSCLPLPPLETISDEEYFADAMDDAGRLESIRSGDGSGSDGSVVNMDDFEDALDDERLETIRKGLLDAAAAAAPAPAPAPAAGLGLPGAAPAEAAENRPAFPLLSEGGTVAFPTRKLSSRKLSSVSTSSSSSSASRLPVSSSSSSPSSPSSASSSSSFGKDLREQDDPEDRYGSPLSTPTTSVFVGDNNTGEGARAAPPIPAPAAGSASHRRAILPATPSSALSSREVFTPRTPGSAASSRQQFTPQTPGSAVSAGQVFTPQTPGSASMPRREFTPRTPGSAASSQTPDSRSRIRRAMAPQAPSSGSRRGWKMPPATPGAAASGSRVKRIVPGTPGSSSRQRHKIGPRVDGTPQRQRQQDEQELAEAAAGALPGGSGDTPGRDPVAGGAPPAHQPRASDEVVAAQEEEGARLEGQAQAVPAPAPADGRLEPALPPGEGRDDGAGDGGGEGIGGGDGDGGGGSDGGGGGGGDDGAAGTETEKDRPARTEKAKSLIKRLSRPKQIFQGERQRRGKENAGSLLPTIGFRAWELVGLC